MISCTEFIPLYSEFFKFLEKRLGEDAVLEYWYHISDMGIGDKTNPNTLISFIERDGSFEGAVNYWHHTLADEACDLLEICDRKRRYVYTHMRHCPSRGRLNALEHIEPYHNYCEHCKVIYNRVLDKYGIAYERDHSKIDNAECFSILYEVGNKPTCDVTEREGREVMELREGELKYLHRDFHLHCDMALSYCGEKFGADTVVDFLTDYTKNYYAPVIEKIRLGGLSALRDWITDVYETEEASELLHTELSGNKLTVSVDKSPVIEYMKSLNQKPGKYYIEQTRTLYRVIAESVGFEFALDYYNEDGGCKYSFKSK